MSERQNKDIRLTRQLFDALRDCERWRGPYIWKVKSMQKLERLGLVEHEDLVYYYGKPTYKPTAAGRAYLEGCKS